MSSQRTEIPAEEIQRQQMICRRLRERFSALPHAPLALVDTYGCQQNEADSERLRGMLAEMGFSFTEDEAEADIVVVNTCAVREHAEMRVLGNVGALSHTKKANREQLIVVCGCMAQAPGMAERIRRSYPYVDLVFGPQVMWRFPELLERRLVGKKRVFEVPDEPGAVAEGLPVCRKDGVKAWLSIMHGCNNFCTYCIVPYVRGRERSRRPEEILKEARQIIAEGGRDITLLGQNVNSYGKDLDSHVDFSDLLHMINDQSGDFVIRFMTSHPKDASEKLFRTMAECAKVARVIHLPFQAGNDRVLKAMNRGYTREDYLKKVAFARSLMPDLVLTSDIIVGFPGETEEEFEDTLTLLEQVRFDALFTFIYSPRPGTPAARMEDPFTREQKQVRFDRLLELQNRISAEKHREYVGRTLRVLTDGTGRNKAGLPETTARTDGGRLVRIPEELPVGEFLNVRITDSTTWALSGVPEGRE